jgi:hypothetical protein
MNRVDVLCRVVPIAAAALLAGCIYGGYHPDMYTHLHADRPEKSDSRVVTCREIVFWEKDPQLKERAGYIETREVTIAGTLETVTQYLVYDLNQRAPFGMINDYGRTSVWRQGGVSGNGRWVPIGNYNLSEAAKALFKRSVKTNVAFEPMPYMPTHD